MQDSIINETGNSRRLRTVAGIRQLCPTYDALLELMVKGEFPFDLAGKDPEGFAQTGTELNKANLLTDATAALMDLGPEATPNEMLAALANKINSSDSKVSEAQSAASSAQSSVNALTAKVGDLIKYSTTDLTAGSSKLATGTVYLVYE